MNRILLILVTVFSLVSCSPNAEEIVNRSIKASGSHLLEGKEVAFIFRDRAYRAERKEGRFTLERSYTKDSITITDVLNNDGFNRYVNGKIEAVVDSMAVKYENSVNSVHYFAYLPFGLNDAAVNKELLGEVTLKGQPYYKIKVWFDQEGGGTDYEDVFIYWIHTKTNKVDYLAYEYHTNGGGIRFREAFNRRTVNGIDFTDHRNFKPKSADTPIYDLDSLYEAGALELLSLIQLEQVTVEKCTSC